ncbi:interleukin-1 receptor accessory protein-like isoform X2 [Myxocyprinus asiaticus]|uniref:interleukin-1 receptor accessory protein-like isoform X2 n=1 Tax=Myxocyprinus asiaticus TaxID=70543 RepID=UPI0022220505|nr:interleukin-1 receptor accessory protein-like isoform X2 [Myxocyprinus asiaticus]
MIPLVFTLLYFCILWMGGFSASVTQATLQSDVQCYDWGVWSKESVYVYDGEVAWLYCPLFSYPTLYSYSQTQNSSLSLLWYRHTHTHELEQPINFKLNTLYKDREYLRIQPATEQDAGLYTCMLRNFSSCVKIGLVLEVIHRDGECDIKARLHLNISIPFQSERTLTCPDLHRIRLPNSTHSVTWYHLCNTNLFTMDRELKGDDVVIYRMLSPYAGVYTCVVSYQMNGHTFNFTRTLNITAVAPDVGNKEPLILNPAKDQIYSVTLGRRAELSCRVHLPHLYEENEEIWWTIDNKTVEQLANPRFTSPEATLVSEYYGDQKKERFLYVTDFSADDLQREFNCSARNSLGFNTSRAVLKQEPYVPTLELGCGLGVTLALMLMMFAVYHVFWLELLLLYRSWFGSDERYTAITDDTLRFVGQSRRLVVVVSPCSAVRGTQALLELQAGLTSMLHGGSLRVVLIQFKPVRRQNWVKELRRARLALKLVRWQGEKSAPLSSRFWKQLQLELPMRRNTHHTDTHTPLTENTHNTNTHLTEDTHHTDMNSYTHNNTHTQNALSGKEKLEDPYSTSAL